MKRIVTALTLAALLVPAVPSFAQLGRLRGIADKAAKAVDDLTFTDDEEETLGADISAKLREKYGVVQSQPVHKYVTLVGSVLAAESSRPNLKWTFIVLDTDGVNAFAAPGGFIHITRGALALIENEAQLADVLAHEIGHVTEKHTVNAIKKNKAVSLGAEATRNDVLKEAANRAYEMLLENAYDRNDEKDADKVGVTIANKAGWAPTQLPAFLTKLSDRNKDLKERSGIFASHPETEDRIKTMNSLIQKDHLGATALVAARFDAAIDFPVVPVSSVQQVAPPSASSSSSSSSGGGTTGLSRLTGLGRERSSNQSVSSAGSRGLNPDRDAKGGPNKNAVTVRVTSAEVAAFRKGITG
ncbi:MAG: M48 family metalloprotease [Vicinamibacterales bacterium]